MHIVAQARSVGSVVVRAENFKRGTLTHRGINGKGYQMAFGRMVLAYRTVLRRPARVKIAERNSIQAVRPRAVLQEMLYVKLCLPVWVYGILRQVFDYRQRLRYSERRASRRKYELFDIMFYHRFD